MNKTTETSSDEYQTSEHQKHKQSKRETVSSTYRQRDDFLPEKWHKTPSASGKMGQMTGSVQPQILPVCHMPARTAERTVSSKMPVGCLDA